MHAGRCHPEPETCSPLLSASAYRETGRFIGNVPARLGERGVVVGFGLSAISTARTSFIFTKLPFYINDAHINVSCPIFLARNLTLLYHKGL